MSRRLELDLLRSLAVVLVVLYHAGVEAFSFGYLGVDVFFVLSGFLVGKSAKRIKDMHSLKKFIRQRMLRILPSSLLIISLITLVSFFLFFPADIKRVSAASIASFFQLANVLYFIKADYFSFNNIYDPLVHFWSIGVEWIFYFLICAIYFASKKPRIVLWVLFLSSILIYIFSIQNYEMFAFYMFPARLWEFIIPALMAENKHSKKFVSILKRLPYFYILPYILLAFVLFADDHLIARELRLISSVIAASLIISFNNKPKKFSYLPARYLAKISFSWYLVHQPIFAFFNYKHDYMRDDLVKVFAIILSLIVAHALYQAWERHFLDDKFRLSSVRAVILIFLIPTVPAFSLLNYFSQGTRFLTTSEHFENFEKLSNTKIVFDKCHFIKRPAQKDYDAIRECLSKHKDKVYIVFGDSHAVDIFRSLSSHISRAVIVNFSGGGCRLGSGNRCSISNLTDFLDAFPDEKKVLIYNQSGMYLLSDEHGREVSRYVLWSGKDKISVNEAKVAYFLQLLANVTKEKIVLLAPWEDPFINPRLLLSQALDCKNFPEKPRYESAYAELDQILRQRSKNFPNIIYRGISETFGEGKENYLMSCSHGVHWRDFDHMSWSGMRFFSSRIKKSIDEATGNL